MARQGRLSIGLYNSYDARRFVEPHRRALARAGAVAAAFDCNLVAFGFPFRHLAEQVGAEDVDPRDARRIAQWVASGTSIGEAGAHFVALADAGRFHVEALPTRGFPPQYGTLVLSTSRVEAAHATTARRVAEMLDGGTSILLLIGLGPHGFPKRLEDNTPHRYEITGKGISLETCTALGAAPAQITAHLEHLRRDEALRDPTSAQDPAETHRSHAH